MTDPSVLVAIVAAGATSTIVGSFLRDTGEDLANRLIKRIKKLKNRTQDQEDEKIITNVISGRPAGQVSISLETKDRNIVINLGDMSEPDAVQILRRAIENIDVDVSNKLQGGDAEDHREA